MVRTASPRRLDDINRTDIACRSTFGSVTRTLRIAERAAPPIASGGHFAKKGTNRLTTSVGEISKLLQPLLRLNPSECAPLPPRRVAIGSEREILVLWQPTGAEDRWVLSMHGRPVSDQPVADTGSLNAVCDLKTGSIDIHAPSQDNRWSEIFTEHLSAIIQNIVSQQPSSQRELTDRAGVKVSDRVRAIDFLPHLVLVLSIAAFVYMFLVVHIT